MDRHCLGELLSVVARPAVPDDLPGVVECALQFKVYRPTPECVLNLFTDACACGGMFVAVERDEVIGFLCALKLPHPFTGRDYVNVAAWWVPADHRGTGAGIALLREMLRWCSTETLDMVTISAPLSSALGKVLEHVGFRPVETVYMRGHAWL